MQRPQTSDLWPAQGGCSTSLTGWECIHLSSISARPESLSIAHTQKNASIEWFVCDQGQTKTHQLNTPKVKRGKRMLQEALFIAVHANPMWLCGKFSPFYCFQVRSLSTCFCAIDTIATQYVFLRPWHKQRTWFMVKFPEERITMPATSANYFTQRAMKAEVDT